MVAASFIIMEAFIVVIIPFIVVHVSFVPFIPFVTFMAFIRTFKAISLIKLEQVVILVLIRFDIIMFRTKFIQVLYQVILIMVYKDFIIRIILSFTQGLDFTFQIIFANSSFVVNIVDITCFLIQDLG